MTDHSFAIFDTAIGRCGIAWGARGINAVQLPMSTEDKTRARIRQRYSDIAEAAPPAVKPGTNTSFGPLNALRRLALERVAPKP